MVVGSVTLSPLAFPPPTVTIAPVMKFVPVIVKGLVVAAVPDVGSTLVTVGGGPGSPTMTVPVIRVSCRLQKYTNVPLEENWREKVKGVECRPESQVPSPVHGGQGPEVVLWVPADQTQSIVSPAVMFEVLFPLTSSTNLRPPWPT